MTGGGVPSNKSASAVEWEKFTSRENVLKLPHSMAMMGYVSRAHGVPRFGWSRKGLRYHYTDAAGLLGIITSSRLWATDIRFLNDPSEGRFLPETILKLMAGKASGTSVREKEVIEGIRVKLNNPRAKGSTFSVSFCEEGDLLSQWRGYGSFGVGYAIGLDLQRAPHMQLGAHYDVQYGEDGLDAVTADLLDIYVQAVNASPGMIETWSEEAATLLQYLAWSFKDPSYSEEKESRIIAGYSKRGDYLFKQEAPLRFRVRGSDIIPYIPLALDLMREGDSVPKAPIKRIVVGPGVDYERNASSIAQLLDENGYAGVEIMQSSIPFRP